MRATLFLREFKDNFDVFFYKMRSSVAPLNEANEVKCNLSPMVSTVKKGLYVPLIFSSK